MKVICDTNIWFNISNGQIDISSLNHNNKLISSYNNIDELAMNQSLISDTSHVVNAIQSVFKYSSYTIIDSPFFYLKKLSNPTYIYDTSIDVEPMLNFIKEIANGETILPEKEQAFKAMSEARKERLQLAADAMNEKAQEIKLNLQGHKLLKRSDRIPDIRNLISEYVSMQCEDGLPTNFEWAQIELFENTMLDFYLKMEKGIITLKRNDWYDMFLLAYVKPGDKIWTRENRWKNIINEAGMGEYLYEK